MPGTTLRKDKTTCLTKLHDMKLVRAPLEKWKTVDGQRGLYNGPRVDK